MSGDLEQLGQDLEQLHGTIAKRQKIVRNAKDFVAQCRALGFKVDEQVSCGSIAILIDVEPIDVAKLEKATVRQLPKPDPKPVETPKKAGNRKQIFTPEMVDKLCELSAKGKPARHIAKELGVTTQQVWGKASHCKARIEALKNPPSPAPKDPPKAAPPQPAPKDPPKAVTPPADLQSPIDAHLDAIGNSIVWPPKNDLLLCEYVIEGLKLQQIAKAMAMEPDDIEARWTQLCPNRNDLTFRGQLHKALIRRAP